MVELLPANAAHLIYLSPFIEYLARPMYAQLFKLQEDHWDQLVLQCRVRPGAFAGRQYQAFADG